MSRLSTLVLLGSAFLCVSATPAVGIGTHILPATAFVSSGSAITVQSTTGVTHRVKIVDQTGATLLFQTLPAYGRVKFDVTDNLDGFTLTTEVTQGRTVVDSATHVVQ